MLGKSTLFANQEKRHVPSSQDNYPKDKEGPKLCPISWESVGPSTVYYLHSDNMLLTYEFIYKALVKTCSQIWLLDLHWKTQVDIFKIKQRVKF